MVDYSRYRAPAVIAFILLLAATVYGVLHPGGLPFTPRFIDQDTAVVEPIGGIPMPAGIQAGDRIDMPASDLVARAALLSGGFLHTNMAPGATYRFALRHGASYTSIAVATIDLASAPAQLHYIGFALLYSVILYILVALLALWKGNDRAAGMLALWGLALSAATAQLELPLAGNLLFVNHYVIFISVFVGRFAIYRVAELLAAEALSRRSRNWLRGILALTMALGMAISLGGGSWFLISGSAAFIDPSFTWLIASPFLVTIAALLIAQHHARGAQRIRLQWMLWSVIVFSLGILARDINLLSLESTLAVDAIGVGLGSSGILYAILRHRVVDVSVVIDRTLVYGAMTSLVVGVVAAMNSLAIRATLGEGAGLLLQVVVPLSLGIVLGKLRVYMDQVVERVFFRGKYLAEKALRDFARRCGHIDDVAQLLDSAVSEIRKHIRTPAVAMYEDTLKGYACLRQSGTFAYSELIGTNDPAMVAVRADLKAIDTAGLDTALAHESCVFPITVLGRLRGVLVMASRPGERFTADEKELLARVARDVGAAWRILRARDNEELVRALADGRLKPAAARTRAKALASAWAAA